MVTDKINIYTRVLEMLCDEHLSYLFLHRMQQLAKLFPDRIWKVKDVEGQEINIL